MQRRTRSTLIALYLGLGTGCSGASQVSTVQETPRPSVCTADAPLDLLDGSLADEELSLPDGVEAQWRLSAGPAEELNLAVAASAGGYLVASVATKGTAESEAPESCDGYLARLDAAGRSVLKVELFSAPGHVLACDDTASVDRMKRVDVDGDGHEELVIVWSVNGEPLPAVGSQNTEVLAILSLPDLAVLWVERVGASGAGGLEWCESTLLAQDPECSGRRELAFERRCMTAICQPEGDDDDVNGDGISDANCPEGDQVETTRAVYRVGPTSREFRVSQ